MPQAPDQNDVTSIAFIALGSNLPLNDGGTSEQVIRRALATLSEGATNCTGKSQLFETPCFPAGSGPNYINAAARVQTTLSANALLAHLHRIEAEFGRERQQRWGQRTLDLDLLAYDDLIAPDVATHAQWRSLPLSQQMTHAPDQLILPHPRLQDRAFVLVPLAEVAGEWRHPVLGLTASEMRDALPDTDRASVRRIAD